MAQLNPDKTMRTEADSSISPYLSMSKALTKVPNGNGDLWYQSFQSANALWGWISFQVAPRSVCPPVLASPLPRINKISVLFLWWEYWLLFCVIYRFSPGHSLLLMQSC